MRLSILIPVYNEANSIRAVLERVASQFEKLRQLKVEAEIVAVDDGSTDGSLQQLEAFAQQFRELRLRVVRHAENRGKGAAIRTAIREASGEFCLIQDADFEYDPEDYVELVKPILTGEADVAMGSRFLSRQTRHPLRFWQAAANRAITAAAGLAANLDLTDVETGYKLFPTALARTVPLKSDRFGLDPELVVQFAKRHARIVEVPVRYRGRTVEQGKKIGAADFAYALGSIIRARYFNAAHTDAGADMLVAISEATRFNHWMAETIRPYITGDVLEFGAGIGNLTVLLSNGVSHYTATDTDGNHLAELASRIAYRPNVRMGTCDLSQPESLTEYFFSADTAICLNVLEHIADDVAALTHIRTCLRAPGRALILVPQGPQAFGSMDEVLEHKRRYTEKELVNKMTAAGFRVTVVIPFNRATWPGWYLNSRILRRRTLSRLQLRIFELFLPVIKGLDGHLPWPPNSLIAVGVVEQ